MSGRLIAPELETFPNRYRWTVDACYRLKELGFLEGRFELIDGEVVNKMGQNPPHFSAIGRIAHWANFVFGDAFVRVQGPITLTEPDSTYSEPEPALAVTREATSAYVDRHPGPSDILLIVEVSDTSVRTDLLVKARLYARAGIPEYWALDLPNRRLHVHREPAGQDYSTVTVVEDGGSVAYEARPESVIAVADLLPPVAR